MTEPSLFFRGVKQVYHSRDDDPLRPFEYFDEIEQISRFIGTSLITMFVDAQWEGPNFTPGIKTTTIELDQVKEKFGTVRVYCYLGARELVMNEFKKLPEEKRKSVSFTEFQFTCLLRDARHYRKMYNDALKLWPYYGYAIFTCASYPFLLHENIDEFLTYVQHMPASTLQANQDIISVAKIVLTEEHEKEKANVKVVQGR